MGKRTVEVTGGKQKVGKQGKTRSPHGKGSFDSLRKQRARGNGDVDD